jgi:hypothetical protein
MSAASKVLDRLAREPVMLGEVIKSGVTLGVAFGLKLTTEQIAALYGFVSLVGAFVVRMFVSPGGKDPPSRNVPVGLAGAAIACLILAFAACSSLTRAERVHYALDGIKAACRAYETYASEIPRKPELDEICPVVSGAGRFDEPKESEDPQRTVGE